MKISIIAALDSKNGIGKDGQLLFKIPEDFKRMKDLSVGHPIIMGRKTFESIGRVLPGRTNIVVTRDKRYEISGAVVVHSLEDALEVTKKVEHTRHSELDSGSSNEIPKQVRNDDSEEIFIFGGGEIFRQVMDKVDRLYLTLVEGDFQADTFFPDYPDFKKVVYEKSGEYNGLKYKFMDLER